MDVETIITSIIRHMPKKNFKMIRYYGSYSRNQKRNYNRIINNESICQKILFDFIKKPKNICLKGGCEMEIVLYDDTWLPDLSKISEKITDWQQLM